MAGSSRARGRVPLRFSPQMSKLVPFLMFGAPPAQASLDAHTHSPRSAAAVLTSAISVEKLNRKARSSVAKFDSSVDDTALSTQLQPNSLGASSTFEVTCTVELFDLDAGEMHGAGGNDADLLYAVCTTSSVQPTTPENHPSGSISHS
jgi:hypothetical protein